MDKQVVASRKRRVLKHSGILAGSLLLAAYVTTSLVAWQSLPSGATLSRDRIITSAEKVTSDAVFTGKTTELQLVNEEIQRHYSGGECSLSIVVSWQALIPALSSTIRECQAYNDETKAFVDAFNALYTFRRDQEVIATQIESAITSTTSPSSFTGASKAWTSLATSESLPTSSDSLPVSDVARSSANEIATAYIALQSASDKEDKEDFDTATKELKAAYKLLSAIGTTSDLQYQLILRTVIDTYTPLDN